MATLEDAILLAVEAHRGQVDKVGQPYILHELRVMFSLDSEKEKIVGVLHDVVEDTKYTLDDLRGMGYAEDVLAALDCLTKREGERYEAFIERIKQNPIARRVKIADLQDNLDLTRLAEITQKDVERLKKYRLSLAKLRGEA